MKPKFEASTSAANRAATSPGRSADAGVSPVVEPEGSESTAGLDLVDHLHSPLDAAHRLEAGAEVACAIIGRNPDKSPGVLAIHGDEKRLNCRAKILARTKTFNRYRAELTLDGTKQK